MKGRTEENIRNSMARMHRIAEAVFDQELDIIPTYIEDNPPENTKQELWYLGESIKKMAEADYFIGVGYNEAFAGCWVEHEAARRYGIPVTFVSVSEMMPDAHEIEKAFYRNRADSWED
jgi:hypothetical protein